MIIAFMISNAKNVAKTVARQGTTGCMLYRGLFVMSPDSPVSPSHPRDALCCGTSLLTNLA